MFIIVLQSLLKMSLNIFGGMGDGLVPEVGEGRG